jgi:F-type H+-transporting ATPase subunit alpha
VDSILPVGRGQRQLILGDRYTGKTSCFLFMLFSASILNMLGSVDGFGSKRIFAIYVGLNQSLNKLSKLVNILWYMNWSTFIFSSHSTSCSLLTFLLPLLGISIGERIRDIGYDSCISFDDLSKHSRSYRQINLLQQKLPSRDAFPSDVFNIHSSLLERVAYGIQIGTIRNARATISSFPIIETINADISEYIATNVISITDGQFYLNKSLFNQTTRPAIDSSLSVSRVGSNAQCKWIKLISAGIKNELTTLRNNSNLSSIEYDRLISLNCIFYQDHLFISEIETSLILLLIYRSGILFNNIFQIHRTLFMLSYDYFYIYYIISLMKTSYNKQCYSFIVHSIKYAYGSI